MDDVVFYQLSGNISAVAENDYFLRYMRKLLRSFINSLGGIHSRGEIRIEKEGDITFYSFEVSFSVKFTTSKLRLIMQLIIDFCILHNLYYHYGEPTLYVPKPLI